MLWWCLFILVTTSMNKVYGQKVESSKKDVQQLLPSLNSTSTTPNDWSISNVLDQFSVLTEEEAEVETGRGKKKKFKKKLRKFLLPLLLAYKLKFLSLIPILVGGKIKRNKEKLLFYLIYSFKNYLTHKKPKFKGAKNSFDLDPEDSDMQNKT
ncbi:hypothetical protein FQA39_LY14803 [Lamprigera yunnana]|nr:hypothetical protein FQA39_LY14803 [Lamprigera yunnana]